MDIPPWNIIKHLLNPMPYTTKEGSHGQFVRAGAITKPTSNAGSDHMRHPNQVKDEGIGRHSNPTLSVRPSEELISIVFKDRSSKDTFLTVTNWTGHHAIMATNTRRESV